MKYLLIDNCSLRHLINTYGYSKYILELENLIASNSVELISHELLIEEWNNHKDRWQKDKERKIRFKKKNESIEVVSNEIIAYNPQISNIHLDEQIKKLDSLLLNSKLLLSTPEIIKNETYDRLRNNLAPFHAKNKSLNDWEIFGSAANYCQIYGITQLFFISHNHTDFGHEEQIDNRVHSSLGSRFENVDIIYYRDIPKFFEEFDRSYYLPAHFLSFQIIPNSNYSFRATIKSNVLDGLYSLYKETYKEINYVPTHLIRKCYPFATYENSETYYNNFTLSRVNEQLIDFFENIKISKGNKISFKDESIVNFIPDYKEKTEYVLRHLTQNLIFHLSGEQSHNRVCCHYFPNDKSCECYRCQHDNFKFNKIYTSINHDTKSNSDKLKQAYIHYQIGNYLTANEIYESIISTAENNKEYIIHFIAKYNQRHLANFLSNPFTTKHNNYDIIADLKKIDPVTEAVRLKGLSDYNFLVFIAQEDFFNDSFQEITKIKNDIIEHYHSQLNGGWSSNSHTTQLIEEFAKIDHLLNNNYIIYDQFSNFSNLFDMVIEGLFASHAITSKQNSRFESFDDYWIHKFISYGSKKSMKKYFYRYKLQSLKYSGKSKSNTPLIELACNILSHTNNDIIGLEDNNDGFKISFNNYFENLLTITAFLDLEDDIVNKIAEKLLVFLKKEKILNRGKYECISYFLFSKKGQIKKSTLVKYFNFFNTKQKFHNEDILEDIINCFSDGTFSEISDTNFQNIINASLEVCKKCNQSHGLDSLISLYKKVDFNNKEIISQKITQKLKGKFDYNTFYLSSIYGLIEIEKKVLFRMIDEFIVNTEQKVNRPLFRNNEFINYRLDQLINLCFMLEIDTTAKRFEKFKFIHPYYDWLLNIDTFNYENFDPEWVLINQIKYYYRRMSKSHNLKTALVNHLEKEPHTGIEKFLIKISYYKN